MCSRQICCNFVMPSCQHGPESDEAFWMKKAVLTAKVGPTCYQQVVPNELSRKCICCNIYIKIQPQKHETQLLTFVLKDVISVEYEYHPEEVRFKNISYSSSKEWNFICIAIITSALGLSDTLRPCTSRWSCFAANGVCVGL